MSMEQYSARESDVETSAELQELIQNLAEVTQDDLELEYVSGTYEIEGDAFSLTFTCDANDFEIRSIDVRGNVGLGRTIIDVIHDYADNNNLEVVASNVVDTAQGFWEKMGYQQSASDEDMYFRR